MLTTEQEWQLEPPVSLRKQLDIHQLKALQRICGGNRGICWHKVGTGKTRLAIAWMFYITQTPRPLVVCSPSAFRTWEDEIIKVGMDHLIDVTFLSYARLSGKKNVYIDTEKNNCLILDEGWLYKNHATKRSKAVQRISSWFPTLLLSGSVITARNIEDVYGQVKAAGLDELIAANITQFRERYTIAVPNYAGFIDRYPKKRALETIQKALDKNISIYFPKETRTVKNITLRAEPYPVQTRIRQTLLRDYYYASQDSKGAFQVEVSNISSVLVKLQQISDGFLYNREGDFLLVKSAKLERLKSLANELLDAGERFIIWVAFRQTAKILSEALPFPTVLLQGGTEFDFKYWHSGVPRACIATIGSGASLNDFADLGYAIFYSTNYNHLQVQQAKGRVLRKGRTHGIYFYYLNTVGFPDESVWDMLEKSESAENYAVRTITQLLAASVIV
jgi:hypothetical protein